MRQIGNKEPAIPKQRPAGANLVLANMHQRAGNALAALSTTGIVKGIYRFATHEEMNQHDEEALARAIAANLQKRSETD